MNKAENKRSINAKKILSESALFILLIVLIIFFSIVSDKFFTQRNLTNILVQNVHVAVCAAAVMLLMISGNVDLSIGYQISITAVVCTMLISKYGVNMWLAIAIAVVVCVLLGGFNGLMSRYLKAHSMMITLGTMAIFQGASFLISQSKSFFNLPYEYMFLGQGKIFGFLPLNAVIAFVMILALGIVLSKTWLGKYVYAAGDNPEAAALAGIKVARVKMMVFLVAGIFVAVAAVLLSARAASADSTTGLGLEFDGITACVLAGCSLKGGVGKLWKVIVAVFVLGVLANGMQLVGLGVYPQYIVKGVVMLISIKLSTRGSMGI